MLMPAIRVPTYLTLPQLTLGIKSTYLILVLPTNTISEILYSFSGKNSHDYIHVGISPELSYSYCMYMYSPGNAEDRPRTDSSAENIDQP